VHVGAPSSCFELFPVGCAACAHACNCFCACSRTCLQALEERLAQVEQERSSSSLEAAQLQEQLEEVRACALWVGQDDAMGGMAAWGQLCICNLWCGFGCAVALCSALRHASGVRQGGRAVCDVQRSICLQGKVLPRTRRVCVCA